LPLLGSNSEHIPWPLHGNNSDRFSPLLGRNSGTSLAAFFLLFGSVSGCCLAAFLKRCWALLCNHLGAFVAAA